MDKREHWKTHLWKVRTDNGLPAYAFRCPCGTTDGAWGEGLDDEIARDKAASAMSLHMKHQHGIPL